MEEDTSAAGELKVEPEMKGILTESEDHTGDSADMVEQDTTEKSKAQPKTPPEEIAPAQENRINSSAAENMEEDAGNAEVPQEPEKEITLMQRRRYMATLGLADLADYLSRHLSASTLKDKEELMAWLKMEVEV